MKKKKNRYTDCSLEEELYLKLALVRKFYLTRGDPADLKKLAFIDMFNEILSDIDMLEKDE